MISSYRDFRRIIFFEASDISETRFRISKVTFVGMKILIPWIFMKCKLLRQSFVAFANISSASSSFICANNTFLSSIGIFHKICWVSDFFAATFSVMCDTLMVQNCLSLIDYKSHLPKTMLHGLWRCTYRRCVHVFAWTFLTRWWISTRLIKN